MFAYCNNNPVCHVDKLGNDPIAVAAYIGAAIAGAVVNLVIYLLTCDPDNVTVQGVLNALFYGAASALVGVYAGTQGGLIRLAYSALAGCISVIPEIIERVKTGNALDAVADVLATFGATTAMTYFGTYLDVSGYSGFDLGVSSYLMNQFTGTMTPFVDGLLEGCFDALAECFTFTPNLQRFYPAHRSYGGPAADPIFAVAIA